MGTDDMTVDEIIDRIFEIGVNSETRLSVMLNLIEDQPAAIVWPVFLRAWPICDATRYQRRDLLRLLRSLSSARDFFDADGATFFDRLPDPVTIYRGCSRPRVRGVSWTTDRDVAAGFARGHRGIRVPDSVVAQAAVPKEAVFAVFTDRNESEVLVDPRRLRKLRLEPLG